MAAWVAICQNQHLHSTTVDVAVAKVRRRKKRNERRLSMVTKKSSPALSRDCDSWNSLALHPRINECNEEKEPLPKKKTNDRPTVGSSGKYESRQTTLWSGLVRQWASLKRQPSGAAELIRDRITSPVTSPDPQETRTTYGQEPPPTTDRHELSWFLVVRFTANPIRTMNIIYSTNTTKSQLNPRTCSGIAHGVYCVWVIVM